MRWEQSLLGVEGPKEGLKMNITSRIWGKARVPLYRHASRLQYYGLCFVNTHQGRANFGEGTLFLSARCGTFHGVGGSVAPVVTAFSHPPPCQGWGVARGPFLTANTKDHNMKMTLTQLSYKK